ncbi:hypothetical protein FRC07_003219 [Ceratobasidium sp. 392]|nr:hypothetical protein FRC07_003219 [Ceratobasidium sp. 392]
MLFGRALTTLVVSVMATLAVAAPTKATVPSTHLAVRDEAVSNNSSPNLAPAPASAPASSSIDSIISEARSDLGAIMSQLDTLDFKNNGTQAINQLTNHLETAVFHFVGNLVSYAQTQQASGVTKRDAGGILGLDPIGLLKDAASVGNEVFAIVNRVKDLIAQHPHGPEGIKQIGQAVSDILEQVSKALPTIVSVAMRVLNAAL